MYCFDSERHYFNRSIVNLFKKPDYSDAVKAKRIAVLTDNTTKTNHNFLKFLKISFLIKIFSPKGI